MKRLLNRSEERTNQVLQELAKRWGANAFPKVRIADVLPIEQSGISSDLYKFALQAHFDFIVIDQSWQPLFAVEFDGPTHSQDEQQRRDAQKNSLCKRFQLPLLRIKSSYLELELRQMNVLSWFINYWFSQRMIENAYVTGAIPTDAHVDPLMIAGLDGNRRLFPLWLGADVRTQFERYWTLGQCFDPGPSSFIGNDSDGTYRAVAYMAITADTGLYTESAMHSQQFDVPCTEILDAILDHQMFAAFSDVQRGNRHAIGIDEIAARLRRYDSYVLAAASVGTQSSKLRNASPKANFSP